MTQKLSLPFVHSEHKIVRRHNQELYTLTIGNKVMINDLLLLGLTPNKSLDVKFPILNKDLYSHFIRGYFDGDGCICLLSNKSWHINFCSGSKFLMDGLSEALRNIGMSARPINPFSSAKADAMLFLVELPQGSPQFLPSRMPYTRRSQPASTWMTLAN